MIRILHMKHLKSYNRRKLSPAWKVYAVLVSILILFPFYWIVISSFKTPDTITKADLWPVKSTLDNYRQLLSTSTFVNGLKTSVIVSFGSMVITLMIVIFASYGLYRFEFKGKSIISKMIILAYAFPGILLIVPVYDLMAQMKLTDTYWALIIMNVTFAAPFCVWLMNGFFASVPKVLDEAASLDGLNKMQILFQIHLPLLRPGIMTIIIYSLISSWTEFTFASILVSSDSKRSLTIVLKAITSSYTIQWGQITAAATLAMIPVVVLFAFIGKYFIGGMTSGSVKE